MAFTGRSSTDTLAGCQEGEHCTVTWLGMPFKQFVHFRDFSSQEQIEEAKSGVLVLWFQVLFGLERA